MVQKNFGLTYDELQIGIYSLTSFMIYLISMKFYQNFNIWSNSDLPAILNSSLPRFVLFCSGPLTVTLYIWTFALEFFFSQLLSYGHITTCTSMLFSQVNATRVRLSSHYWATWEFIHDIMSTCTVQINNYNSLSLLITNNLKYCIPGK